MTEINQSAQAMEEQIREPDITKNIFLGFNGSKASIIHMEMFLSRIVTEEQKKRIEYQTNSFMVNLYRDITGTDP